MFKFLNKTKRQSARHPTGPGFLQREEIRELSLVWDDMNVLRRSGSLLAIDASSFRKQESALIILNLLAMEGLVAFHATFRQVTDATSYLLLLVLFSARMLEQAGELFYLAKHGHSLSPWAIGAYGRISIAANILFAGVVSIAADSVDAHYSVLLIIPVIAAGFRLAMPGVLAVIAAASGLTFLEIWVYFLRHPPMDVEEFFEAATESLVYVAVGLVVWKLAGHMRQDAAALKDTIAKLEQTRDKLVSEEKLAAVGRLAGAIAHEIRNPVGMIASSLTMASRPNTPAAVRTELSEIAAKEANRLEKLTSDFLSYARTKAPEKQPLAARQLVDYVAGLARARFAENEVQLQVVCPDDFEVRADPFQMQQALINLLTNAMEHTSPEGIVLLGAERNGAWATLYVENSPGPIKVSPDQDIFEPFFTTSTRGSGLGLPISRNIARAHNGDLILAQNTNEAIRFALLLPME